jgi:hypothetical protein
MAAPQNPAAVSQWGTLLPQSAPTFVKLLKQTSAAEAKKLFEELSK